MITEEEKEEKNKRQDQNQIVKVIKTVKVNVDTFVKADKAAVMSSLKTKVSSEQESLLWRDKVLNLDTSQGVCDFEVLVCVCISIIKCVCVY